MILSIIIPAYNNAIDVLYCLNSLQATATDNTVIQYIIQDDASLAVDFRKIVPPYAASVARNERNVGFSANCNAGAARAQGDVLAFVNQDIEANVHSPGWDNAIRAAFENVRVGIVAPRLLFPDGKVQSVGGGFDSHLQPYHRCLGYSNLAHWEVSTPREVEWVTGAFLAVRSDVFQQVGGFDETYVSYFEDCDLCLQVREAGYKVMIDPRVSFIHKVGSTGGSPYFMNSARTWKQRWADTRKVKADTSAVLNGWW